MFAYVPPLFHLAGRCTRASHVSLFSVVQQRKLLTRVSSFDGAYRRSSATGFPRFYDAASLRAFSPPSPLPPSLSLSLSLSLFLSWIVHPLILRVVTREATDRADERRRVKAGRHRISLTGFILSPRPLHPRSCIIVLRCRRARCSTLYSITIHGKRKSHDDAHVRASGPE